MTRNTFSTFAMIAIMAITSITANAQRHSDNRRGEARVENGAYRGSYRGGRDMHNANNARHNDMHRNDYRGNAGRYEGAHRSNVIAHHAEPRYNHQGYVHGWENRVRHENGRWGYYRDNRWYWYNRYFEPTYYYGHPVAHFNDYYYIADGCYIPGWEGRVIYRGGRWGYLRGNNWYWYDRYYEPDYYYAHPVAHFHSHISSHAAHRVANGIASAIVLGALINAVCY